MSLHDSFREHGSAAVSYNPLNVISAARAALDTLERSGERRVIALAVAGLLVRMQAALAGDTIDNTIALMRGFIDTLDKEI